MIFSNHFETAPFAFCWLPFAASLRSVLSTHLDLNGGYMFNRKSSYALNKKDPNAIVYMDANDAIIRLTREDFASEEEFLKWKSLSDADYHASEKEAHIYANHTLALDELSEEAASVPAVDVFLERAHDQKVEIVRNAVMLERNKTLLSESQFRRMWLYRVNGLTVREIAEREQVRFQCIHRSIVAAEKKIFKFSRKLGDKQL